MAGEKISQLADGSPAKTTYKFPVARSGANYEVTLAGMIHYSNGNWFAGLDKNANSGGQAADFSLEAHDASTTFDTYLVGNVDAAAGSGELTLEAVHSDGTTGYLDLFNGGSSAAEVTVKVKDANGVPTNVIIDPGQVVYGASDGTGSATLSLSANGSYIISFTMSNGAASGGINLFSTYTAVDVILIPPVAFASLPATPVLGMVQVVTDSNTATWGANAAGGGANIVLVGYNGSHWTVMGK